MDESVVCRNHHRKKPRHHADAIGLRVVVSVDSLCIKRIYVCALHAK